MRFAFVVSALLVCGVVTQAQQTVPSAQPHLPTKPAEPIVLPEQEQLKARLQEKMSAQTMVIQAQHGCPIAVSARRSPVGSVIVTGDATHPARAVPQALLLHVTGPIAELRAIAYGPAAGAHVMPIGVAGRPALEQSQSFTFTGDMQDADGDFRLGTTRLSTLQRVDLLEVRFTNGTVWTADGEHGCVVVPSGYLPV